MSFAASFKLTEYLIKRITPTSLMGLCFSDGERWGWQEILDAADEESRALWEKALNEKITVSPLLGREIAKQYTTLDPAHIGVFGGAQESGYHVMQTLLNRGDHVVVVTPCYQFLKEVPNICDARVEELLLKRSDKYKLDLQRLKEAIKPNTKLLVLNYPHNPTGKLLTLSEMKEVCAIAKRYGTYVLNDEIYRGFELDEKMRLPSIADLYERGIAITSLSKLYGLPTLRIGWVACQSKDVIERANNLRRYTSSRNSELSELFALMVLRGQNTLLARNRKILHQNFALLSEFFARHRDALSWTPPECGAMAFPKLELPIPIDTFVEELYHETNIVLVPDFVFDVYENAFRITFGKNDMARCLAQFEQFLTQKR